MLLLLEILILIPFISGVYIGVHAVLRPSSPPNFEAAFKRKYRRSEWNERNPETFTRKVGGIVLAVSLLYGAVVVVPWVLR